ncbi:hypothetical protein LSTR_LSTR008603 [Laodelphax striatellus]|uniref:Cwf19-like C-terminal domain-containing protein n=1 Tax=Laodelphax striatellus TaxID=195883 RepID=A0A482WQV0_LAOST|nr:hypothetical protein LSTR_LSTR008603 [Laodelphax striatellus]
MSLMAQRTAIPCLCVWKLLHLAANKWDHVVVSLDCFYTHRHDMCRCVCVVGDMSAISLLVLSPTPVSRLERAREAAAAPERVVLTVTDSRGFTQPLAAPTSGKRAADGRGKPKKTKTHDDSGKRVRYFADDDRFTLQEMFEREKRNTAEDQNEMFARLAGKKIGDVDSARDMDDVFEETAAARGGDARQTARDEERARARAIGQHKRATRAHDNCDWCLESRHLLKHLVVAVGSKVYLCLPPYESLTEGHCLIVTSQHVTCCVQADEEVWEEIQVFRKALVDMFLSQDLDCVLFEHAAGFSKFPHMVLHYVPLPKEHGDLAPIYFKKAILECETEWSTNKKLIDLGGGKGGVRRCVPRGLPYFFVDFGLQAGYAHVIEDEQLFPRNFAQEIIGGILDVDHSKWRKPRREKFDDQRKKVVEFTKLWKPFDFTKKGSE